MSVSTEVAVFLPLYHGDRSDWFESCLKSIAAQKDHGLKITIYLGVDGPIGANLEQILSANFDLFHRIVRCKQNRGLGAVLNSLITAKGSEEYIFRVDSDDLCLPLRFHKQVEYMKANPDVDVLGTSIIEWDGYGSRNTVLRRFPQKEQVRKRIRWGTPVAHPTVCFRGDFFDRFPNYPETRLTEDIELWVNALIAGAVFDNLQDPLVRFRLSRDSISRRGARKALREVGCYLKAEFFLNGIGPGMLIPLCRFIFRFVPNGVAQFVYSRAWFRSAEKIATESHITYISDR